MPKVWHYYITPSEFWFIGAILCYNNSTTSWFRFNVFILKVKTLGPSPL